MHQINADLHCDVLIVGAGIAGLMAAQTLQAAGKTVIVVDREGRVGGRMITEHINTGWADTGAQFFSVREPVFQKHVSQWVEEGLVFVWSWGWADSSTESNQKDGFPRYAAYGGMTAVPRRLAQDVMVHKSVEICQLQLAGDGWQATSRDGYVYGCKGLVLTPPVPQTLALLQASQIPLDSDEEAALAAIVYHPNITAVCQVEGAIRLPSPGALQRPWHPISWVANNQPKMNVPQINLLTAQFSPTHSRLWWQAPDDELTGVLHKELRPLLAEDAHIVDIIFYRWPHALPTVLYPEYSLLASGIPPLAIAGDAFKTSRVEGAAMSGIEAAKAMLGVL